MKELDPSNQQPAAPLESDAGVSRRDVLLTTVATVGALVGVTSGVWIPEEIQAGTHRAEADPVEPTAPPETPHEVAAEIGRPRASKENLDSAIAVTGTFLGALGYGLRRPLNAVTAGVVNAACFARNLVLSRGSAEDKKVAAEERVSYGISAGILGALGAISEITARAEIDYPALAEHVRNIGEGLDAEAEQMAIPELDAGVEDWEKYAHHLRMRSVDVTYQNMTLSGSTAGITHILTVSTFSDTITINRFAPVMADYRFSQAVIKAKRAGVEIDEGNLRDQANVIAEKDVKSMAMLMIACAANIHGTVAIGGGPNLPYLINNDVGEWLKMSGISLVLGNATSLAELQLWLVQHLGLDHGAVATRGLRAAGSGLLNTWVGITKSLFTNKDAAFKNNEEWAANFDSHLRRVVAHPKNTTYAKQLAEVGEHLKTLPRLPFEYDRDGLVRALAELYGGWRDTGRISASWMKQAIQSAAGLFTFRQKQVGTEHGIGDPSEAMTVQSEVLADEETIAQLLAASDGTISSVVRMLVEHRVDEAKRQKMDKLMKVFDTLVGRGEATELSEGQRDWLRDLYSSKNEQRLQDAMRRAEAAYQRGDHAGTEQAVSDIHRYLAFAPKDTQESVRRWETEVTGSSSDDPHATASRGLNHTTKEILYTGGTQLPAGDSVAVVMTEIVAELADVFSPMEQDALIIGLFGSISLAADNILSYRSGSTTLNNAHEDMFGPNFARDFPELHKRLERAMFLVASWGGQGTIVGSLAGLKHHRASITYNRKTGKVVIKPKSMEIGETFVRGYNGPNLLFAYGLSMAYVYGAEKEAQKRRPAKGEAARAPGTQPGGQPATGQQFASTSRRDTAKKFAAALLSGA